MHHSGARRVGCLKRINVARARPEGWTTSACTRGLPGRCVPFGVGPDPAAPRMSVPKPKSSVLEGGAFIAANAIARRVLRSSS